MARPLRLEAEAGVFHVLNRGNYRLDIFRSEKAKAAFLTCLAEACEKTGWEVHAWCLMTNHYHLAVPAQIDVVDLAELSVVGFWGIFPRYRRGSWPLAS